MPANPDQLFIAIALSRGAIYDELQEVLDTEAHADTMELTLDHLTDEVCQAYTDEYADILRSQADEETQHDAIFTLKRDTLQKLGWY
jgi:hypothetical protein